MQLSGQLLKRVVVLKIRHIVWKSRFVIIVQKSLSVSVLVLPIGFSSVRGWKVYNGRAGDSSGVEAFMCGSLENCSFLSHDSGKLRLCKQKMQGGCDA